MKRLLILSAGGDRRFSILSQKLSALEEVSVYSYAQGTPDSAQVKKPRHLSSLSELPDAPDILLLPIPLTRSGETLPTPLEEKREPTLLSDLFPLCKDSTHIYGGLTKAGEPFVKAAVQYGLTFTDYLTDEPFALLNADATAEAAIGLAIDFLPITLRGAHVLVTGGGRIAKSLVRLLTAFGAEVTAGVRSEKQRCELSLLGAKTIPLSLLSDSGILSEVRLVFNTIPAAVFGRKELLKTAPEALLVELASEPGGFEREALRVSGRFILRALSLPGKTAPESSAEWLTKLICASDPRLHEICLKI